MSKLLKRIKKNEGNAIAILGIMLIVSVLMVGGLMLDISKAFQMKASYVDAALKATQSAVRIQTTEGYLRPTAAAEAIRVYEQITRPSVINEGTLSKCGTVRSVDIEVWFNKNSMEEPIFVGSINSTAVGEFDTMETIYSNMTKGPNILTIINGDYTAVELRLTESTPNVILPGVFKTTGATQVEVDGIMCQYIGVNAAAKIFNSESNIE